MDSIAPKVQSMQYAEASLVEEHIAVKAFAAMAGMLDSEVNMAGVDTLLIENRKSGMAGFWPQIPLFLKKLWG